MSIPLTSDGRHFLPYTFSLNSLKLLANLSLLLIGPYIVCHMLIFGLITVARRRDYADQFKLEHKLAGVGRFSPKHVGFTVGMEGENRE